ncbi:MAG: hypothetical protein LUC90_01785 [Lachnospiraceae bacterium]|nr:hypothetical protein [Lachnospiraceae bacterium]
MKLELYVMDIRELERADLCAGALRLLDPVRKEKALRAANVKDRARSVGAGLLLLLGHAGLKGSAQIMLPDKSAGENEAKSVLTASMEEEAETGLRQGKSAKEEKNSARNESLQILSPALIIQTIEREGIKRGHPLADGICYEISDQGRPSWKKEGQNPYFNLSHSGNYAVLVTGDAPVGVDVQEPRRVLHRAIGDYQSFCRLESYLKCTGRGIDRRIDACYGELEKAEKAGGYFFKEIPMPDEYALWVCAGPGRAENS